MTDQQRPTVKMEVPRELVEAARENEYETAVNIVRRALIEVARKNTDG